MPHSVLSGGFRVHTGLDSLVDHDPVSTNGNLGVLSVSRIYWCFDWDSEKVREFVLPSVVTGKTR